MKEIAVVFWTSILPVLLIAGLGALLRRRLGIEATALSRVALYALAPCLAFDILSDSHLPAAELSGIIGVAGLSIVIMGVVSLLIGSALRMPWKRTVSVMLAMMFVNAGNYGLTLVHLRYGEEGLARGVVYFTVCTASVYSVGVFLASTGRMSWWRSGLRLLRLPPLYAVVAALIVARFDVPVPAPINAAVHIVGQGAVPVMLLVLGMQLADVREWGLLRVALPLSLLRLGGGAVLGVTLSTAFGLSGVSRAVAILNTAMPTAVVTTIVAAEFDLERPLITAIVVCSTLLSPFTLTATIALCNL